MLPDPEALYAELLRQLRAAQLHATLMMVGIHRGGVWLAKRLHADLSVTQPLSVLDVSFYRDDIAERGLSPSARTSSLSADVNQQHILLVDDVIQSGRTIRAALQEIFDCGRPARVDVAVLVDRGRRELPICANYCGATLSLPPHQQLELTMNDHGKLSLAVTDL